MFYIKYVLKVIILVNNPIDNQLIMTIQKY